MNKAFFLDRDGVLNQTVFRNGKARAPYELSEFKLFDGVPEAIEMLRIAGYKLIVVTNQPDVARGWVSKDRVDLINNKIQELLNVDDIKVCFHTEKDNCECRKPRPGMLIEAGNEHRIDLSLSFMAGDRASDVQAGKSAGCKTILIGEGDEQEGAQPDHKFKTLLDAARFILKS